MDSLVKKQILKVRNTALTNMLDTRNVKFIAKELDLTELNEYLKNNENIKEYISFILYGKL